MICDGRMLKAPMIRQALESDCAAITACAEAAYHMYIERMGKPPAPMVADFKSQISDKKIYLLEQESLTQKGQLLGFVVCFLRAIDEHQAESAQSARASVYFLENIAVNPQAQRAGNGIKLINHVTALAIDNGCSTIELYTNELMTENIAWYKKLGFTEFDRVIEDGFSRVYMRLVL